MTCHVGDEEVAEIVVLTSFSAVAVTGLQFYLLIYPIMLSYMGTVNITTKEYETQIN
jgi:hypothetical protein